MPGNRPHHTDKWRSCVDKVMAQGHDESSASAICTTSLQKAGEDIYVAEAARHLHLLGALGKAKTMLHEGREHLVVPVVALMEGVIHAVNAATPEFVSLETLKKAAASWAGKPVTLGHPKKDGKQCSANSPDVLAAHGMGFVRNPRVEGKKLLCEAWIDKLKAKALHPAMYDRLLAGEREEVSVGAYVVTDNKAGEFKGKPFMASWLETAGDHLAFLPGGRGACSIDMGCGAHRAAMRVLEDKFEVLQPLDTPDTPEAAASEEAAELIAYQSLRTMMDGVGDQWDQASKLIDDLIADEEENPTETPAQEEAEEEVEAARLDSIRAFCQSMIGGLSGIVSATYSSALMPDPVPMSDPRYMAMKSCPTCDGSGQVKDGKKQADCPTCNGSGKMMTAEARALLGSRHSKSDMAIIQNVHDHAMALGATCDRANYKMLGTEEPCGCHKEKQLRAATIRNEGGKWTLYTKDGSRKLGQHNTEAEAIAQEKAIEAAKLRRASEVTV